MVALAYPQTDRPVVVRPALTPVPGGRVAARARAARLPRAIYWRRRAVAAAVLAAVAVGLALALGTVLVGLGGGPLTATESSGVAPVSAGASVHVVEPGDTLWSIVRASGVRGDPRPVVDRLQHELGGRPLQVGQRVLVP
jgi:hypothetical protein